MLNIFWQVKVWKVLLGCFSVPLWGCLSDRNIEKGWGTFQVSFIWTGTQHFRECEQFPKSYFLALMLSISITHFSTIWQDPTDAAAMFWLYSDNTLWRSQRAYNLLFFTEGTRESQKMLSTAIHQLSFPSPALGRLCPPFLDKAELHWWLPHESHLCHPQRQKWLVSHSASGLPGQSDKNNN